MKPEEEARKKIDTLIIPKGTHTLSKAEERIIEDYKMFSEAELLFGLAFENYFKSIWILQNKQLLVISEKIPNAINTHDMSELCNQINMNLNREEGKLIRSFQTYVEWYGRYPIPNKKNVNIDFFNNAAKKLNMGILFQEYPNKYKLPEVMYSLIEKIMRKIKEYPEKEIFYSS